MRPPSSGSGGGGGSGARCYVSSLVGFLLVLLTLVLVIGVSLVVFFSSTNVEVTCRRRVLSGDPGSSTGALQDAVVSCKSWVENGGNASESICHACPSWQTSTTTPSAVVSTTTPPYDRSQYRLPATISPLHYNLRLQPHIYGNDPTAFFFQGSVTIDVICHDVTDLITLHADRLAMEDSDVTVQEKASGLSVNVRKISFEAEPQFVHIHLRESLRQGVEYRIVIARFSGPLRNDKQGLYVTSYLDGDTVVYLAATRFNAIYARKAFPCFDEPSKKATFNVTLARRMDTGRNYHSLSNMDRIQTFASSSLGWVEDVYQTTVRMSTHQLTFLVSDFDHVANTTMGVRISMWSPHNAMPFTGRAQELGRRIFQWLETRFVPPYSSVLNKLDVVSVPGLGYGVEGSMGLVLYGDNFLAKPALLTTSNDQFTGLILAHTLSHLWFGTLVTPAWWNWQWMSESLASFWHMTLLDDLFSNWRMTEEHVVGMLHGVMTSDALASSRPLTADVESPAEISSLVTDAEIDRLLSDVNYVKGPFLIRLIHFIMGKDRFLEALNNYVSANKFENVQPEDMWAAFNNVSLPRVDIGQKMDPWVTQKGYPVVMVTRTGRGRLRLQQQRFWVGSEEGGDGRYKDPPSKYQWEIPITITSSHDPNFTQTGEDIVWMEKDKPLTSLPDPTLGDDDQAWFIINIQQCGYYRVSYDHRNWINLIRQLNTDHKVIHPINRAQIINDAWNLAKANMLDMDTALKTVDFLSKEVDYLPWRAFSLEMYYVQTMLERTDLYSDLQTFMVNLISGPLQQLGLDITPDLDPLSVYTRMQLAIFACRHGHPTCVRLAQQQLKEWRVSGQNGINPNLRRYLYCTGVERGGRAEWNFVLEQYRRATEAEEMGKLRHALACAREPALLYRLLIMAMEGNTNQSLDVSQVIRDVSANPWGRDIAFQFLGQHFSPLVALLGSRLNGVISSVTAHFNSDYDLHRLSLLESTCDTSAFASAFKQARTKTQINKDWLQKHRTTLKNWLQPKEQKEEKINYRLPGDVVPRHYRVELQPHLYGSDPGEFFFEGSATIRVQCIVSTPLLTLHVHRLNISDTDISVRQVNSHKELFRSSSYDQLRQFWHLRLTDSLQAGKTYLVEFRHFSGPLTAEGYGLYLSYYRDGETTVYLATSQSNPVNARKVFPCFDEPQLKATFDITLVRRNDTERHYISLSNAPLSETSYTQDGQGHWWARDRFETTPIMSTYILAFIVCDFVHLQNTTASDPTLTFSTYARPNAIQWAERAQVYGMKAFDWLNRRFKPPYGQALTKLDNVAIPDFTYGAMENWGLVIYREAILYHSDVISASDEFQMAYVLAHEMAHKWFGNYVSPKWYNWMWMNKALASWWGVFATDQIFPRWMVTGRWVSESLYPVMEADALLTSHPMTADVQTRDDIYNVFDDIIYSKGGAVIRMMQFIMGLDTFVDGLNLYLANNLYGNVETADLLSALDQKMREQHFGNGFMTEKMDPWISQMGFPVVMVTRTPRGYQLTQKRFLIGSQGSADARYENAPYNYEWEIPIIYATSDDTNMAKSRDDIHWLSKNRPLILPEVSANDSSAWILINIDQMAYCRVLYDTATWHALIGQLNRNPSVIPAISRGQIINDAWNLAKAGMLELSVALSTLDFLESESDLVPWSAFSRHMDYVHLMLRSTDLYPPLQTYMQRILQKPLQTLTLNIEKNMAPSDVSVRTLIAEHACKFGLAGCVNTAKRLFRDWKSTGFNVINVNLRRQFYCTAVAEGDVTDWQFVYGQYKSAVDVSEVASLRHALSCTKDPVLLRRVLNMALDPAEVRTQDLVSTLQSVSANPQGRSLTFRFCVDHWATLLRKVDVLYLGKVLISVTSHFNTEYDLQQLHRLRETRNVSGIISAVEQAVAQTRTNMDWVQTNYPLLRHWLTSGSPTPTPPAPVGSYRLPPHLVPYHYDLSLKPHIYGLDPKQFFFEGNVTIFFSCASPTPLIVLHQDRLTIDTSSITVTDVTHPDTSLPVDDVTEEERFHFYKIHLRQSLTAGGNYSVQFLNFRGDIRNYWQGLFSAFYKEGDKTIFLAATQLQPTYTRQVFPCFDEPALKATCAVTLVRRTDTDRRYITLSNMPVVSSTALDGQWTADVFQRTMRMPIYLLAFVVCDFAYLANSSAKYPVQIRTYAPRKRIDEARGVQDYSVQLFEWYNDHFEPNYETFLSKLDQIAIPNLWFHAMENWGLITYRARPMLYNSMSTVADRAWIAEVPSHELSHMWFGNKVSPKWWTWIWLNEGLSDYWQNYAVEQLYPNWKDYSVVYKVTAEFYAMRTDSYSTSHPLSNYVEIPEVIHDQFDTITYLKGAAISGMMHMIMGEHFIPALNVFLTDNQLGSVEHKDLFDSMNKYISGTTGIDVNMTEKMEPWVTQMGYPVVNVHRQGNQMILTQQRFLLGSSSPTDTGTYGYMFEIPITYTTSSEKNFTKSRTDILWLRADGSSLTIPMMSPNDDWVVVNLRHEGYYRVNYDVTTWKALIAQLNADHTVFHEVNRAALIDDAFNLAKAELLPLEIALQTVNYMKKEMDYGPWWVFRFDMDHLELMIERTELFADFQRFIQNLVDEPLKTMGFDLPPDNDPPIDVLKMSTIISYACKYDHVTCVTKATGLVSDWMNGLDNRININLRSTVYCTAVREGGHDVWEFIYHKYQSEINEMEKSRLRSSLGCAKDPTTLYMFLDACLSGDEGEPSRSETSHCLYAVANSRYGRDVAVNFLLQHFPLLKRRFSARTLGRMVSTVTQHFHDKFHLAQLQHLVDRYDLSGILDTVDTVRQRILTNMRWMDKNLHTVQQWLADQSPRPAAKLSYRLPTAVVPYHYDLELQPEIYGLDPSAFTFNGTVTIFIRIREPTTTITLHSDLLDERTIRESARLLFENGTDSGYLQEVTFDASRHFLSLALSRELRVTESFRLYVEFWGMLPSGGMGLYYTSYKADDGTIVYLVNTEFSRTFAYARRTFPCFDEPAMKATVNVTLVRKDVYNGRTYRAWSNNELLYTESRANGYVADHFETTPVMPTYALVFIVADFQCLSNVTKHDVTYRTCARPNAYYRGHWSQNWGMRALEWLEDHLDPPYPLAKIDNVAIPDLRSFGMEGWGLIPYRETILYQGGISLTIDKEVTAINTAHNYAHMWFGNLVTPEWWNWLWLKEAFAYFWHHLLLDILQPRWRQMDKFVVTFLHGVMSLDSMTSSHPVTADVESPIEVAAIFDPITYGKGTAVIRLMHFLLGQDNFIAGLNVYLREHQYGSVNHTHLFGALDKYLNQQGQGLRRMSEVMEPWVTQMGYPVVHVHWSGGGQVTLTQRRFLTTGPGTGQREGGSEHTAPFGYSWDIPITMATSVNTNYHVSGSDVIWFNKTDPQLTISRTDIPTPPTQENRSTWVLVNVQQYGYYRVNYPDSNWLALILQLKTDPSVIHPINRAQIINDAWSFARSGHLSMDIALQTLQVLKNDGDYVPWQAMSGELRYLDLMLSRKEIYGMFEDYMMQLVNNTYEDIGMTSDPSDPPMQIYQRQAIVAYACKYGVHRCRQETTRRFSAWKSGIVNNELEVDMRRVILCNGIRFGDKDDWDFVYEHYLNAAPRSAQQFDYLSALACSSQAWLLQRLLDLTLNSTVIMAQDVRSVLESVSANPIGRDMAFTFLKRHFYRLLKLMTAGNLGSVVVTLTQHFNIQHELDEVKLFMSQNDVSMALTSFRQVVGQTSANIKWMQDYYHQICHFLQDRSNW